MVFSSSVAAISKRMSEAELVSRGSGKGEVRLRGAERLQMVMVAAETVRPAEALVTWKRRVKSGSRGCVQ